MIARPQTFRFPGLVTLASAVLAFLLAGSFAHTLREAIVGLAMLGLSVCDPKGAGATVCPTYKAAPESVSIGSKSVE